MAAIVWFRADLRVFDHEPLIKALAHATKAAHAQLIPVFCFDNRLVGPHARSRCGNFPRSGVAKTRFLLESVADLRASLRALGSNLVVCHGAPEMEVAAIAARAGATAVFAHAEVCSEEVAVEKALAKRLGAIPLRLDWGAVTLHHLDDLPFKARCANLPAVFTSFRQRVEAQKSLIRRPQAAPTRLPPLPEWVTVGDLPTLDELCGPAAVAACPLDARSAMRFEGGEAAGLARVAHYLWGSDAIATYKDTRNGLVGADYSTKFSPWLAHGCITARFIYAQVLQYERERTANDSTYWVIFELLWRDYFRFVAMKHGTAMFREGGIREVQTAWRSSPPDLDAWCNGTTGFPFVDANMRELAATGFMSNRGRQNVASFLTKDLMLDWRLGAEWFEGLLIDHDPCANYGNWNYAAGIGNDPRQDRHFNVVKQGLKVSLIYIYYINTHPLLFAHVLFHVHTAKTYDEDGVYVHRWLPELRSVSSHHVHTPWTLGDDRLAKLGYNPPVIAALDNGRLPLGKIPSYPSSKKFDGPKWMRDKAGGVACADIRTFAVPMAAASAAQASGQQQASKGPPRPAMSEDDKRRKLRLQNKY
jgi:deoxyribodipyrimidine photo-lyase